MLIVRNPPADIAGGLRIREGNMLNYVRIDSMDVYYNLALEEYIFENYRNGTWLLLWINDDSLVMGKFQNVCEEVNLIELERRGINLARRNSGGGTVFHDKGNLNYSLITDYDNNADDGYERFIVPVTDALKGLGVCAKRRGSGDIVIGEDKISGSAQAVRKGRILHHGTLLFDADLKSLKTVLSPTGAKITSKSVKSIRSSVTNIKEHIRDNDMNIKGLRDHLLREIAGKEGVEEVRLSPKELHSIQRLRDEKYTSWEWIYSTSPEFAFEKNSAVDGAAFDVKLSVRKGIIAYCDVKEKTDRLSTHAIPSSMAKIEDALTGCRYTCEDVRKALISAGYEKNADNMLNCFF